MSKQLAFGNLILIPDEAIGETVVDEMFDAATAARMKQNHPLSDRCDTFIARDPGDNLFVLRNGSYFYWDHETDTLIELGNDPETFISGDIDPE